MIMIPYTQRQQSHRQQTQTEQASVSRARRQTRDIITSSQKNPIYIYIYTAYIYTYEIQITKIYYYYYTYVVGGWVSPCGVSPRGVWGLCPLRSFDDAVSMILSPHPEPTSGCSEPDSGWQSAAARPGTTLFVPAPGRPPDHHHGCGTWPAAAEQCSKQDDQGLPTTRTGSEYEDDLRACGADRYVPTDAERSEPEPPNLQEQMTAQREQMAALTLQLAVLTAAMTAGQPPPLQSAKLRLNSLTGLRRAQLGGLLCAQAEDLAQEVPGAVRAVRLTAFVWASSMLEASPGKPLSRYAQLATLQEMVGEVFDAQDNMQQFLEEQELSLAEDHIAFDAASRIQADKDEARENELLRVQAVRFLEGQERLLAQNKDNAQYLEQENAQQAGIKPDYTMAARPGEFLRS